MRIDSLDPLDPRADDRVRRHTRPRVNQRIDRTLQLGVLSHAEGDREGIIKRIQALDREWDLDRALMAWLAFAGGTAFVLGRRGLLGAQLGFLAMHATIGWCPPLIALRRLGFRTAKEISAERLQLIMKLSPEERGEVTHEPLSQREAERLRES